MSGSSICYFNLHCRGYVCNSEYHGLFVLCNLHSLDVMNLYVFLCRIFFFNVGSVTNVYFHVSFETSESCSDPGLP